jgi:ABC-type transporter Mla subunit MlaD
VEYFSSLASNLSIEFRQLPLLTQYAIVILIVSGVIVHLFSYNARTAHDAPSIFTTGGIFFTFVGIAEGLFGFDVARIEDSVPLLLGGLKTAFLASVVGVFIALSIKLRSVLFGVPKSTSPTDVRGASVDDLYQQMVAVQQSIAGKDESTLVSQIKLQRQDTNDRLDLLRKSQSEFMSKMAENNSRALIDALREVIRDFNAKISEQFGENFKQLNLAVGQMLEWQTRYREQVSEMIGQQAQATRDLESASLSLNAIVAKAESFTSAAAALSTLLTALAAQRADIERSLEALGRLLASAESSLPKVEDKILTLTSQMTMGVNHHQQEITKTLKEGSVSLQSTISDVRKTLLETTQLHNQEVNAHFKQLGDRTTEQIAKMDLALERELTKSISTLAIQLTALSKQFVDDYGPLTERLREIVRMPRALS